MSRAGFEAFDALSAASSDPDLEIASRARYLLRLMRVQWTMAGDPPDVKKCLDRYESEDQRTRLKRMQELASLPNEQGVTALCRLVRFEKSASLSKRAALALISSGTPPSRATVTKVHKSLGTCKRPAAEWVLAWTRIESEPDAVMSEWPRFVANEEKLTTNETSAEIIAALIRFQIGQLKKLGKTDEAVAAISRLVNLQRGDVDSLASLLQWLVEQKAWKAVDDLAKRFKRQFASEPSLAYALAAAYLERGQTDLAEAAAARGFALNPGKRQRPLLLHLMMAQQLRQQGHFAWSRREFEHVITESGDAVNGELRVMAQAAAAEMLHDQGQDLDAAETLAKLVGGIDAGKVTPAHLGDREPGEIRARMNFFYACHWEAKGDVTKQREYLDKALKADETDVDVLIACYRLPQQPPDYHAKIVALIQKAAATLHEQIAEESENPLAYALCNQYAWLIANTEGDFDEALRCSQKSVEQKPDEGGLYDTLAHVYFAKGDFDNAVKQQTKAAELEPYSGLIKRQLNLFRKKQAEKKKS